MSIPRTGGKRKKKLSAAKKVARKKVSKKTKRVKRPLSDVTKRKKRKKTVTKPHTTRKPSPSKKAKKKKSKSVRRTPPRVSTRKTPKPKPRAKKKKTAKKVYQPKPIVPKRKRASKKFVQQFFSREDVAAQVRDRIIEKIGLKALTAGFVQTPESIIQAELIAAEQLGIFERRAKELAAEYHYTEREIYTLWLSPEVHFS